MKSNPYVQFLVRLYGWLLRLYPPRFQDEFGPEMLGVFHQAAEEASKKGNFALVRRMPGELSGLLLALFSLRKWKGDGRMDQKDEKLLHTPAPRLPAGEIILGMLPLIVLGLGVILSSMPTEIRWPAAVTYIVYFLPYMVVMAGCLWGWLKGFPRWVYPYLVYGVFFALYFSLSGQPTYKVWVFDLWDWIPFAPVGMVILLALRFGKSPLQAAAKMVESVWKDWTLLGYGLYGLLPILIPILEDETDRSYRFPVTAAAITLMLVCAVLYVGTTKPWLRTTSLLGGLFLSLLTASAGAELYWKTHDINIITNERRFIGGPVPWGDILPQSILLSVGFTLILLLLPLLVGLLHWLIDARRSRSSGAGA